jgi:NhaP-type Na+/H+ or K+/H+ antiporter
MDRASRGLIVWFGPRGLSTILLILLPVFAAMPGAGRLFHLSTVVVLLSVALHGVSIMVLDRKKPAPRAHGLRVTPRRTKRGEEPLITPVEVLRGPDEGRTWVLADVRSAKAYNVSDKMLRDSVRLDPDNPVRSATEQELDKSGWIALFCT